MLVLMLGIAGAFLAALRFRDREVNPFELGVFFFGVVLLYAVSPIVTYLVNDLRFPPEVEYRVSHVVPRDVAELSGYYAAFLAAFAVAYMAVRKRVAGGNRAWLPNRTPMLPLLIALYLLITGYLTLLQVVYNLSSESYADVVLSVYNLPLLQRQIANSFNGMLLTLAIVLMCRMVLEFQKYRWIIISWLTLETLHTLLRLWSRTYFVCLIAAFVISYHYFVKRLRLRTVTVIAAAGVAGFLLFGAVRSEQEIRTAGDLVRAASEFTQIWANAYHMSLVRNSMSVARLFPSFYFADFAKLFPQQLVPFEKVDLGTWYVSTFFPISAKNGIGLAFGIIPESMIGFGLGELVLRGALLGVLFGWLHRSFATRPLTLWRTAFYFWLMILSYQTFRASMFSLVPVAVYHFLLPMLAIELFQAVIRTAKVKTGRGRFAQDVAPAALPHPS